MTLLLHRRTRRCCFTLTAPVITLLLSIAVYSGSLVAQVDTQAATDAAQGSQNETESGKDTSDENNYNAAQEKESESQQDSNTFTPSEEISEDKSVAFPVDI